VTPVLTGAIAFGWRDSVCRAGTVLFGLLAVSFLAFPDLARRLWVLLLFPLTAAVIHSRLGALPNPSERRFWRWFEWAFALGALPFAYTASPWGGTPEGVAEPLLASGILVLSFLAVVGASEERPDRVAEASVRHRTFELAAMTALGFGLFVYFVAIPTAFGGNTLERQLVHGAFGAYLVARFATLAYRTPSQRWRLLYAVLALALAGLAVGGLAVRLVSELSYPLEVLSYVPFFGFGFAARLREFKPALVDAKEPWPDLDLRPPRVLTYSFLLVVLHLAFQIAAPAPAIRSSRDALVLVVLLVLAGLARSQYHALDVRGSELDAALAGSLEAQKDAAERERRAEAEARATQLAAERANEEKSAFFVSINRELRSPLNSLLGFAQVLEGDRALKSSQRSAARTIRQSGEHLLALIGDVVELADIESGRVSLRPAHFALVPLIENLVQIFRMRAETKGLTFEYRPEAELPEFVEGDDRRLRQLLINLLGNAVKYTGRGRVILRVRAARGEFECEIADTGPGLSVPQQAKIFDPFERLATREPDGTGLGLAICRTLVQRMGGRLDVSSAPGRGSVFRFVVSLPVSAQHVSVDVPDERIVGYRGTRLSVLVVDTEPERRLVFEAMLVPFGFEVRETVDALAAQSVLTPKPDLVLIELDLADAGTCARLRQRLAEVPIIGVAASADDVSRPAAAHVDACIARPIVLSELLSVVQVYVGLEWKREPSVAAPEIAFADGKVVPSERLRRLRELAHRGDIRRVLEELASLRQDAPAAGHVWDEVQELASSFRLRALRARVEEIVASSRD